jgi:hypothetical protein
MLSLLRSGSITWEILIVAEAMACGDRQPGIRLMIIREAIIGFRMQSKCGSFAIENLRGGIRSCRRNFVVADKKAEHQDIMLEELQLTVDSRIPVRGEDEGEGALQAFLAEGAIVNAIRNGMHAVN